MKKMKSQATILSKDFNFSPEVPEKLIRLILRHIEHRQKANLHSWQTEATVI
jgi:hypothetical protein